ncbi:mitochondrial carrier domain-containing protein [Hygrophoropsis aurantiaca]|uniref:Mitochondrial carrier domain-containing protein n=1 Tax=Hygrophoropsis aurantiaca TaxID=72124 RepID=A0ACB7ZXM5_9AGAM|nr:mitochondrial carrier domain-containing protein [Hygrophoropsis aurantiaca]
MTSTLPPFVQASSGSLGSAVAKSLAYPLDLVTTRIQAQKLSSVRDLIRKHGFLSFYDGLTTDAGATLLSSFLYYYAYSFLRSLLTRGKSKTAMLSVPQELATGYLAGIFSRALTTPLSIITVQLQTERDDNGSDNHDTSDSLPTETGFRAVCRSIYRAEGVRGFWKGFSTTFLLSLNPAITLFLFQVFRRLVLRGRDRAAPTPGQAFVGGAVANSIAVTVLYPLILSKTLIQTARTSSSNASVSPDSKSPEAVHTIRGTLMTQYNDGGVAALYRGLHAQILKGVLTQGVAMMVKQRIEQLVIQAYLRRRALRSTS